MEDLIIKIEAQFVRLETFIKNYKKTAKPKITQGYVQARLEALVQLWTDIESQQREIEETCIEDDHQKYTYLTEDKFAETEDKYFTLLGSMKQQLIAFQPPPVRLHVAPHADNNVVINNDIKIPRIALPKFSGDYILWRSFHDLFVSAVHNNAAVPLVQKLQYLKSLLTGEAEHLLRQFQVTEANYVKAWKVLCDRYDNKRVLLNIQLKTLLNQPVAKETALGLRNLLDTTNECLQSLENLGIVTESWDPILVYLLSQRLPEDTHVLWEQSLISNDIPEYEQIKKFLENRFRTLEMVTMSTTNASKKSHETSTLSSKPKSQSFHTTTISCSVCNGEFHQLKTCPDFLKMDPKQRWMFVQQKKLCKNCFAYSHKTAKCRSSASCSACKGKHSTLLHLSPSESSNPTTLTGPSTNADVAPKNSQITTTVNPITPNLNSHVARDQLYNTNTEVLLSTALVSITSEAGGTHLFRALLDQGSQASFITETAVQTLGLQKIPTHITITGIGRAVAPKSHNKVQFIMHSRVNDSSVTVEAFVMPALTHVLPSQPVEVDISLVRTLQLADPKYGLPGHIDILLSADIYAKIMLDGLKRGSTGSPIAQQTTFGWILCGLCKTTRQRVSNATCLHTAIDGVDRTLRAFWELEEVETAKQRSPEDVRCEEAFKSSTVREVTGRYKVRLPFKSAQSPLGSSRDMAVNRFLQLERRFQRNDDFRRQYTDCIEEYITLNQMVPVSTNEDDHIIQGSEGKVCYTCSYLPHHGVLKESSSTTKLRVVFDASSKSRNGMSLNDTLMTGPTLQDGLVTLITRWRQHAVVLKADIAKMYRQILVSDSDSEYQRIVWRSHPSLPIKDYRLRTVTFGTTPAPYLAVRSLQQLAVDEKVNFPNAAKATLNDFYVDDLMTGADTEIEAIKLQTDLIAMLHRGGFEIRKWASNSPNVTLSAPPEYREIRELIDIDTIKTLGLNWDPSTDT